tara:strand:+ start:211 stop:357 length:147 start_codon:yes stop_codon:yes gene_type:complete
LIDSSLKDLPIGARAEFRGEEIAVLIRNKSDKIVHLSKNVLMDIIQTL